MCECVKVWMCGTCVFHLFKSQLMFHTKMFSLAAFNRHLEKHTDCFYKLEFEFSIYLYVCELSRSERTSDIAASMSLKRMMLQNLIVNVKQFYQYLWNGIFMHNLWLVLVESFMIVFVLWWSTVIFSYLFVHVFYTANSVQNFYKDTFCHAIVNIFMFPQLEYFASMIPFLLFLQRRKYYYQ